MLIYHQTHSQSRGFTIVEILTTIAIISVLASVVLFAINEARENSRIKAETAQVEKLMLDMMLYRELHRVLPPGTYGNALDNCSLCRLDSGDRDGAVDRWNIVTESMTPEFTPTEVSVDSWGNPYAYDNNYLVTNSSAYSTLCSLGPNGELESDAFLLTNPNPVASGDDICVFFR